MADKHIEAEEHSEKASYELDLDDTISAWDQVVEEAVAAVERKGEDVRSVIEKDTAEEETDTVVLAADEGLAADEDQVPPAEEPQASQPAAAREAEEAGREDDTEVRNLRDQLVRTLADFDNFRKRSEREKATAQRYALFDVLKDFLGVFDNLERALAASGSAEDLKMGVQMIARQFSDLLGRYGVEKVESVGKSFDPTVHEAVTREESTEVEEPTVKAELQSGYQLHDRLLRPALVTVAMPPPRPSPSEEPPDSEEPPADATDETGAQAAAGDSPEHGDGLEQNEEPSGEQVAETTEVS